MLTHMPYIARTTNVSGLLNGKIMSDAQAVFDDTYITSSEIRKRLKVAACTVTLAHQKGVLPKPPITVGAMNIWVRKEIEPYLVDWGIKLQQSRRTVQA